MVPAARDVGALALIALAVFATQPRKIGFERGHHGWVSSHTLAIVVRATPENGFVGHASRVEHAGGRLERGYHDRYPVLFSALTAAVLARTSDGLGSYVQQARLGMDAIYVGTIAVAYATLRLLLRRRAAAFGAVLFAVSGWYFVHFKDMVHFDQPALLGLTGLGYALTVLRLEGRSRPLYVAAVVAPLLGRGWMSVAALLAWTTVAGIAAGFRRSRAGERTVGRDRMLRPLFAASVVAVTVATLALAYNVAVEARRTGVAWSATSIVASATNRLGGSEAFDREHARALDWPEYLAEQARRLRRGATPAPLVALQDRFDAGADQSTGGVRRAYLLGRETLRVAFQIGFAVLLLLALRALVTRADPAERAVLLMLALPGFVWLLGVRRLAAFHEYTTMVHLGFYLAIFTLVARSVPERWIRTFGAAAAAVFVAALVVNARTENAVGRRTAALTEDFERLEQSLPVDARVFVGDDEAYRSFVDGAPFALGFYGRRWLFVTERAAADYVLERETDEGGRARVVAREVERAARAGEHQQRESKK